jgi:hypothetical protein
VPITARSVRATTGRPCSSQISPADVIAAQAAVVRPTLLRRPSSTARCQSATLTM